MFSGQIFSFISEHYRVRSNFVNILVISVEICSNFGYIRSHFGFKVEIWCFQAKFSVLVVNISRLGQILSTFWCFKVKFGCFHVKCLRFLVEI